MVRSNGNGNGKRWMGIWTLEEGGPYTRMHMSIERYEAPFSISMLNQASAQGFIRELSSPKCQLYYSGRLHSFIPSNDFVPL
jgi:hypothetical protein